MQGPIYRFMTDDHRRLDALLKRATADSGRMDRATYAEFRAGLLKHIAMEEKILLPATQRAGGGEPLSIAGKLRLEHGALAALLVPSPTHTIVAALRAILRNHNRIEEGPGGLYETCDRLLASNVDAILAQLRAQPEVAVRPHLDSPEVMEATRRALARASYDWNRFESRIPLRGKPMIKVRRVYEPQAPDDGARFLVDRLWPRGLKKEALRLDGWLKDVAPSDSLRRWFGHDPKKWAEFQRRYFAELKKKRESWEPILEAARQGNVTLLFGAHDPEHNNAVALRDYLTAELKRA